MICPSIALAHSVDHEWGFEDEIALLVVHGVLHLRGWDHEIKEFLGALGVNSVESMRGSRERLRGVGLDAQTLEILGVKPAGR